VIDVISGQSRSQIIDLQHRVRFSRIGTKGIHLNVAEAGPNVGPLVILHHGFLETVKPYAGRLHIPIRWVYFRDYSEGVRNAMFVPYTESS
jgi:hypothetical protein